MSMNLNIPITQTITLPDSWQACKTPQELSYWIIAKFDNFTTQFTEINNAMSALQSMIETNTNNIATNDAEIAGIKTSIANINTSIGKINTSIETLNNDYGLLHSNYMAMNNRLATVEDVAGDIPTIKTDITGLQTTVNENRESIIQAFQTTEGKITQIEEKFNTLSNKTVFVSKTINVETADGVIDLGGDNSIYHNFKININLATGRRPIIKLLPNSNMAIGSNRVIDIFYKSDAGIGFGSIDASSEYVSDDIINKLVETPMGAPIHTYTKTELTGLSGQNCGLAIRIVAYQTSFNNIVCYWCIL